MLIMIMIRLIIKIIQFSSAFLTARIRVKNDPCPEEYENTRILAYFTQYLSKAP